MAAFDEGFPAGLTTGQRVELLLRRLFAMTERRREILTVFLALPMGAKTAAKGLSDGYEVMRLRLARWFRENERLGPRGRRIADDLAVALLSLSDGFVSRWLREEPRTMLVNQASLVADLFLNGALPRLGGGLRDRR